MVHKSRPRSRRTKPVGIENFEVWEDMQLQFTKCFCFSTVDMDEESNGHCHLEIASLPPGTPRWISNELVQTTIQEWQPYSEHQVESEVAIAILINIGELLDVPIEQTLDNDSRQGGLS